MRLIEPVTFTEQMQRSRLWRDDLSRIVEIVRSVDSETSIRTDKYILHEIDELRDVEENRIRTLRLSARSGQIRIYLSDARAELSIEEPDHVARGMASEIADVLERRRVLGSIRFRRIGAYAAFTVVMTVLWVVAAVPVLFVRSGLPDRLHPVVLIVVLAVVLIFEFSARPPGAVMYTHTRAEQPPWFERNRDTLITNAIVSAVFLILGLIIGHMLPK